MTPSERPQLAGRRVRIANWPLSLALLLLLLVGCTALGPLLRGSAWWWAMALSAAAVFVAATLFNRFGVPRSLVPILSLAVLLSAITLMFGRGTGLAWLIPTAETMDRLQRLIGMGFVSIQRQATPAEPVVGIQLLLFIGAGLIAALMYILAVTLRWPALAGLPVLVPILVPGLLVDGGAELSTLVLSAAAYLLLLRVDARARRRAEALSPPEGRHAPRVIGPVRRRGPGPLWGAISVGSIGIVCALVLSSATPAITGGGLAASRTNGLLFGAGVSPMINLGQDLRRPEPTLALHYQTAAEDPPYLKLLTLDQFVGSNWVGKQRIVGEDKPIESIARPTGLSDEVESTKTRTAVVIDRVVTTWLPSPSPVTKVEGLNGKWHWNRRTAEISSPETTTRDQSYTVTSLQLEPTKEQLRSSSSEYPWTVEPNLHVPFPRPDIIAETASEVTAGTNSAYDAAVALQDYLRGSDFEYDTEAPVEDGYDGAGVDLIGQFLEVKTGYCVHFASAMAIMARTLGIPARISVGYLPGSPVPGAPAESGLYQITSHDLHSWPELYFVGVGWIPFEPTPGRGSVPSYARPADAATGSTGDASASPGEAVANDAGLRADTDAGGGTNPAEEVGNILRNGLTLALVAIVLLIPGVWRRLRRIRRIKRLVSGRGDAALAWSELTDTALDHGAEVRHTETPRELAGHLLARPEAFPAGSDAAAALERLLVADERQNYDRPGHPQGRDAGVTLARDLSHAIRAIHSASKPASRWRATMLPASLWRGVRTRWIARPPAEA